MDVEGEAIVYRLQWGYHMYYVVSSAMVGYTLVTAFKRNWKRKEKMAR